MNRLESRQLRQSFRKAHPNRQYRPTRH
jgi:hypothetical protein